MLLAFELRDANRVVKSRNISSAVSNKVASEFYRLQDYNYFCFIETIRDSKKLHEKLSFLVVSQLKGWKFLTIQTPRQIINMMTLFAFMSVIGFDINNLGDIGQHFPELQNADVLTFCVMVFTSVMFLCSVIATFAAIVLWIPLSVKIQGNLKRFVNHKTDRRIDTLVKTAKQRTKRSQLCEQMNVKYSSDDANPGLSGSALHLQSPSDRASPRRQKPTLPNIDIILANSGQDGRRSSKARNAQQFYQQQQQHLVLEADHGSQPQSSLSHYLQPNQYYQDPTSVYPSPASSSQQLLKQSSFTELSSSPIMHSSTMVAMTSPVLITARHSMRREQPQLHVYQNGALFHQQVHPEYNQDYHEAYPRTPGFAPDYTLGETGLESWRAQQGFPAGEDHECTSPTAQQFMGLCRPDSGVLPEMTGPYYKRTASLESERERKSSSEQSSDEQDAVPSKTGSVLYQPGKTEIEQYNSLFKGIAESHQRVKANRSKGTSRIYTQSISADPLGVMDSMEQQGTTLAGHSSDDTVHHQERYPLTPDSSVAPSSREGYAQNSAGYDDPTCSFTAPLNPPYVTFVGSAAPSPAPSRSSSDATSPRLSQRMLSSPQVYPSYQQQGSSSPSLTRVSTTPLRRPFDASVTTAQVAVMLGNDSIDHSRATSTAEKCELDDLHALRIDEMIEDLTASLQTTPRSSVASFFQAPPRIASPLRVSSPSPSMVQGEFLDSRIDGAGPPPFTAARSTILNSECKTSSLGGSLRTGNSLCEGQKRDTSNAKIKGSVWNAQEGNKGMQRGAAGSGASTEVNASEHDHVDSEDEEEEDEEEMDKGELQIKHDTAHGRTQVYRQPKRSWTASTSTLTSIEHVGSRSSSPVFKNRTAGSSTTSLTQPAAASFAAMTPRPPFYQAGPYSMSRTSLELESWGESSLSLAKKSIEMARASIDRPRTPMERSGLSVEFPRRWEQ
ncbi:hypothetical protein BGZ68_007613 [Mortierella alpina]|nr:hypothetical protein BGZ68_007613 [Mortierella alpina]